jgi:hypothetical protein
MLLQKYDNKILVKNNLQSKFYLKYIYGGNMRKNPVLIIILISFLFILVGCGSSSSSTGPNLPGENTKWDVTEEATVSVGDVVVLGAYSEEHNVFSFTFSIPENMNVEKLTIKVTLSDGTELEKTADIDPAIPIMMIECEENTTFEWWQLAASFELAE